MVFVTIVNLNSILFFCTSMIFFMFVKNTKYHFHPSQNSFIYTKSLTWKMHTFKACFWIQGPRQSCGPELKTKLHDSFEPFSASYRAPVMNRDSEVIFIKFLHLICTKQHYLSCHYHREALWNNDVQSIFRNFWLDFIL